MNEMANNFLKQSGCCSRCIQIFEGRTKDTNELIESPMSVLNNGVDALHMKRNCLSTCPTCLGILQLCCSENVLYQLSEKIRQEDSDCPTFSLTITLPICLTFRIHSFWVQLISKFPDINQEPARLHHYGVFKDIWRTLVGPKIAKIIKKEYTLPENAIFNLAVIAEYSSEDKECFSFEKISKKKFDDRRMMHRKFNEGVYSRSVVNKVLEETSDETYLEVFPDLPAEPSGCISYENSKCLHSAIYIAGRYNKYSRNLPQTPWIIEGERKMESSIEELINEEVKRQIRTTCVFSSSGREDVDVRCLGSGRPFVLECLNPRKTLLSQVLMTQIQDDINKSTELVQVKDFQVVSRKSIAMMKEGEEEKTKSYIALCLCREGLSGLDISQLDKFGSVTLDQVTPLRVLHRRPLATRNRTVHSMDTEVVDDFFFKVTMVADAGTYIKEFVHGDMGRTVPNLGTILGRKMDIVALDVTNVKLDWPPSLNKM